MFSKTSHSLSELIRNHCSRVTVRRGRTTIEGVPECRLIIVPPEQPGEHYSAQLCTDRPPGERAAEIGFSVQDEQGTVYDWGVLSGNGSLYFSVPDEADVSGPLYLQLGSLAGTTAGVEAVGQAWRRVPAAMTLAAAHEGALPPNGALIQLVDRNIEISVPAERVPFGILAVLARHRTTGEQKIVLQLAVSQIKESLWVSFHASQLLDVLQFDQYVIEAWPLTVQPRSRMLVTDQLLEDFCSSSMQARLAVEGLQEAIAEFLEGPVRRASQRPVVACIRRSGASLQWGKKRPSRILPKTEMARDSAVQSELRFAERLSRCELQIQIETRGQEKFLVAVLPTFLDRSIPAQTLLLRMRLHDGTQMEANINNVVAEFPDLPAGIAELLILQVQDDGTAIEFEGLALKLELEA
ncbi:MAG: hypothetical protein ACK48U_05995 [Planctomyces sp.]